MDVTSVLSVTCKPVNLQARIPDCITVVMWVGLEGFLLVKYTVNTVLLNITNLAMDL